MGLFAANGGFLTFNRMGWRYEIHPERADRHRSHLHPLLDAPDAAPLDGYPHPVGDHLLWALRQSHGEGARAIGRTNETYDEEEKEIQA